MRKAFAVMKKISLSIFSLAKILTNFGKNIDMARLLQTSGKRRVFVKLRRAGIPTAVEVEAKSLKSQMRSADRLKAVYTVIVGDSELESGTVNLKRMADGVQEEIKLSAEALTERLK